MKTLLFVYFALVIIALSSCQKSGEEAVVSGMNSCVVNPASCNNASAYSQNQGYTPYGYSYGNGSGGYASPFNYYNNSAYLCNCPAGSIPTYNSYSGLGCVRNSGFSYKAGLSAFFYIGWGNNQWNTIPQLYRYNYGYNNGTCYNGAVQSCNVSTPNSCPSGYICRPSNNANTLGLCVSSFR